MASSSLVVPTYLIKLDGPNGELAARRSRNNRTGRIVGKFLAECNQEDRRHYLDAIAQADTPAGLVKEFFQEMRRFRDANHRRTRHAHAHGVVAMPLRSDGVVVYRDGEHLR